MAERIEWVDRFGQECVVDIEPSSYGTLLEMTVDGDKQRPRNFMDRASAVKWVESMKRTPLYAG